MSWGLSFKQVATGFNAAPLLTRLAAHPELWQAGPRETYPGSAHSHAQSIMVRWIPQAAEVTVHAALNATESVDYPAAALLMPEVGEAVMSVLERIGVIGELGHVILTRLPPGAALDAHMDEGIYADLYDRFHLCLQGDLGNRFECGGEIYHPEPGEIFWFNHKRPHEVRNNGSVDRIHLIVDAMAPAFTELRGLYYQAELVSDLWEEAMPLLEAHWREVAHYQDIELKPDVETYARMQAAGQLRCYTARDSGRLIGYVVFFVRPNPHYAASIQAHQDVLFVALDYRRGMVGVRLIKVAEQRLRAEGAQVIYHHAKRTNKVGELLARLGYELVDEIYAKRLDLEERKGR